MSKKIMAEGCPYCGFGWSKDFTTHNPTAHAENDDPQAIKDRLEYLRGEIRAERISYEELAELQSLAEYIEPGDSELLQWATNSEGITLTEGE